METTIKQMLAGNKISIPANQRSYSWETPSDDCDLKTHTDVFLSDLEDYKHTNMKKHFKVVPFINNEVVIDTNETNYSSTLKMFLVSRAIIITRFASESSWIPTIWALSICNLLYTLTHFLLFFHL